MKNALIRMISLYQVIVRPFLGMRCRFDPSCSEYARQAFSTLGFFEAASLSARRILRCQPFCAGGPDPVVSATRHG